MVSIKCLCMSGYVTFRYLGCALKKTNQDKLEGDTSDLSDQAQTVHYSPF